VRELRFARGIDRRLVWSWYDISGWQTASAASAKAAGALRRLTLQRGDATLVALSAPYDDQPAAAREHIARFLRAHPQVAAPRGLTPER
jgi:EpsI family protein